MEMLIKAQNYMNAEDAIVAIRDIEKLGDKGRKEDECRGQKRDRPDRRLIDVNRRKDDKGTRSEIGRASCRERVLMSV